MTIFTLRFYEKKFNEHNFNTFSYTFTSMSNW